MVDITHKGNTLREASAKAIVAVSKQETIDAILNRSVPKGDVFEMSRAAGLLGVKKTSDLLPDCHPMPIESTSITYNINGLDIEIIVEVKTIYKTGVEVEAMHGASIVALNMYDMLKPLDKNIEIKNIALLNKKGGKSSFNHLGSKVLNAAVIVCSDTISKGQKHDSAGKSIAEKLKAFGVEIFDYTIIPDEIDRIQEAALNYSNQEVDLIIFTGGTGLSPRDVTPEALIPLFDRQIPGIEEAIRSYGQNRTPYSMLSRSVVGIIGTSLTMGLPGSTKGASESIDAVFPAALHLFKILKGGRHD